MKRIICLLLVAFITAITNNSIKTSEPQNKISDDLSVTLENLGAEDEIQVYVFLYDLNKEIVMNKFSDDYPDEYDEYCKAEETDTGELRRLLAFNDPDYNEEDYIDPINGDLFQQAIEIKRSVFAEEYQKNSDCFIEKHNISKVIYASRYSPMIILSASKSAIYSFAEDESVCYIDLFEESQVLSFLNTANSQSGAALLRDYYGFTGNGVKIGMLEGKGIPDVTHTDLLNASIILHPNCTTVNNHATKVARIIVGSSNGIVPDATLYAARIQTKSEFYERAEWLISQGVNIINFSGGFQTNAGSYTTEAWWIDHIAIQHDVHFVVSAGNEDAFLGLHTNSAAMAYNAISVGAFDDKDTQSVSDDTMWPYSCYLEIGQSGRAEKPNLVAAGVGIALDINEDPEFQDGTSFAAPQVTGVIAQLCCYDSSLKTKQTVMGAILEASAINKVEGANHQLGTDYFYNQYAINGQISGREGAGKLSASEARKIIKNGKYYKQTIYSSSFPYTKNVYIGVPANSHTRVAIFWLKRNSIPSSSSHTTNFSTLLIQEPFSDLNLEVYAPDGTLLGSSTTTNANFEIVQFDPPQSGYYRIVITKNGSNTSGKEFVGIAVW